MLTAAAEFPACILERAPALIGSCEVVFSEDRAYRYRLTRRWGTSGTHAIWVMLNPSTADHRADDPTVRRCTAFTKAWGLDGLTVVNLFALRSTDPARLATDPDPVGPANDYFLREAIHPWSVVVAAWGAHRLAGRRAREVLEIIAERAGGADCLGVTKAGFPRHPLYVPASTELRAFSRAAKDGAPGTTTTGRDRASQEH